MEPYPAPYRSPIPPRGAVGPRVPLWARWLTVGVLVPWLLLSSLFGMLLTELTCDNSEGSTPAVDSPQGALCGRTIADGDPATSAVLVAGVLAVVGVVVLVVAARRVLVLVLVAPVLAVAPVVTASVVLAPSDDCTREVREAGGECFRLDEDES